MSMEIENYLLLKIPMIGYGSIMIIYEYHDTK
jgi:hypothetical protein